MGAYRDAMRRISQSEFSENQPKPEMKIVTKIERVQPCFAGVDDKGNMVWEGREMPRWQQELFRKTYHISKEEFGHLWDHMATSQGTGGDNSKKMPTEPYWAIASQEHINQWKKWGELVRALKKKKRI